MLHLFLCAPRLQPPTPQAAMQDVQEEVPFRVFGELLLQAFVHERQIEHIIFISCVANQLVQMEPFKI